MNRLNLYRLKTRLTTAALAVAAASATCIPVTAASFTASTFATGTAVAGTQPDSVSFGGGSLWIEYGNGASSTDFSGTSTIVQYSPTAAVQHTWQIAGSVDGLKYDPSTGMVWALQNQDANSRLSLINPSTKAVTSYTYGAPYTSSSATRGFDDVAFIGNNVYMSETNPATTSDPVIVKLTNSTPTSPVTMTTVQTGAGIAATDADSLKSTPTGGLILTGEADGALNFIDNPGQANQSARSIKLSGANGFSIGNPDDAIYATSTAGIFYVTDTSTNQVLAINATGLTPGTLFVNVGDTFGSVDPSTGVVTPLVSGTGLHGMDFVATPEPSTLGFILLAAGIAAVFTYRRRHAS
ncbi:MAG TPA: PEP-CTERM sorting domain-containing protein [Bryobacteraceae bacterium]|nr:PEP-CTERM sorting domain-containing protein [Bryobacteraceae bacterium]